ncbi:MAG TPA: hypothetical protein VKP13_12100, partial [Nitrospira sp.]|nr:hypothetical protein [Nitrospira sp.]
PVAVSVAQEVFLLDPLPALLGVPSPAPPPHHLEDPVIHIASVRRKMDLCLISLTFSSEINLEVLCLLRKI